MKSKETNKKKVGKNKPIVSENLAKQLIALSKQVTGKDMRDAATYTDTSIDTVRRYLTGAAPKKVVANRLITFLNNRLQQVAELENQLQPA